MSNLDLSKKKNFKRFIKFHKKQWNNELVMSASIPSLRSEHINTIAINSFSESYSKRADLVNIVITLLNYYTEELGDLGSKEIIIKAIKLYKAYFKRIRKLKHKAYQRLCTKNSGGVTPYHEPLEAWKELIARGFIPRTCCNSDIFNKKNYYIKGNIGDLVFPCAYGSQDTAWKRFEQLGVSGYSSLHQPEYD